MSERDPHPKLPDSIDPFADAVDLARARHEAVNNIVQATVNARTSLIRDTNVLAVPLLVASFSLLALKPGIIRTFPIFIGGALLLGISIVIGGYLRSRSVTYVEQVASAAGPWLLEVTDASRMARYDPRDQGRQERLINAETANMGLPPLGWIDLNGFKLVVTLFLVALGCLAIGLLLRIQI